MDFNGLLDIDRAILLFFNGSESLFLDGVVVSLTNGLTWIPLYMALLFLVIKNNENMAQIMLAIGCAFLCVFLADGMTDGIIKPWVGRLRPLNDPAFKSSLDLVANVSGDKFSFFSAHAANTMSIAIFFCLLVRSKVLNYTLFSWSLINCWTRLYLGMHYPSDIICGILWGCVAGAIGYVVFKNVYRRISTNANYISCQYTQTGYDLDDINMVLTIVSFILIYVVMKGILFTF